MRKQNPTAPNGEFSAENASLQQRLAKKFPAKNAVKFKNKNHPKPKTCQKIVIWGLKKKKKKEKK